MAAHTETLKTRITEDMKSALRKGDKARLGIVRLMLAAIKQREVDERVELDNQQILGVLDKMVKQRRESWGQYKSAGRDDLADQEQFELDVINTYLPKQLSEMDIEAMIETAILKCQASTMKDMGQVMNALRAQVLGRADMAKVSAKVKKRLSG
jgi:uncharacterized protein YqeY